MDPAPTKMGPLAADHPLVTGDTPCGRCLKGFNAGDYVKLDLLPPEDPEQQERAAAGRAYRTEGLPIHWTCATWPWWYLSFADTRGFLGGCYVEAPRMELAHTFALAKNCNPGGEVVVIGPFTDHQMRTVPERKRHRLLTRAEIEAAGPTPY